MKEIELKKRTPKQRLDWIYDQFKDGRMSDFEFGHWEYDKALADYLESEGHVDIANKLRDLIAQHFQYA